MKGKNDLSKGSPPAASQQQSTNPAQRNQASVRANRLRSLFPTVSNASSPSSSNSSSQSPRGLDPITEAREEIKQMGIRFRNERTKALKKQKWELTKPGQKARQEIIVQKIAELRILGASTSVIEQWEEFLVAERMWDSHIGK